MEKECFFDFCCCIIVLGTFYLDLLFLSLSLSYTEIYLFLIFIILNSLLFQVFCI